MTVSPSKSVVCTGSTLGYQTIPDLAPTACADDSVSFSFLHVDGGVDLTVNWGYDAGRNLTGKHSIADNEIVWTNQQSPTGVVQVYEGPKDFIITDLQAIAVL